MLRQFTPDICRMLFDQVNRRIVLYSRTLHEYGKTHILCIQRAAKVLTRFDTHFRSAQIEEKNSHGFSLRSRKFSVFNLAFIEFS